MLTNSIKKKIDNCRDILVGKIPDPKSQIEQITIALIYKFMNDIDNESIELGGSATFFAGEFSRYKWANIVDVKLNGYERLNLYAEAIEKMGVNNKIPQLFRDIFKNAFLPYRDPETFTLFAKEINEFHYEHSEELGNAYEYLLQIMSSQGDAGQFRTPRNIIDFIVEVIQPKKNETILDPACGTAGFLISAYKYIKEHSKDITPDENKKLTKNIVGYDISPDMVRLSLVNLYLHSFPDPKIFEYDTLTSEDRWKDTFDIIMANPPFMSPKGGIKPHNKFAIKVNRSEVLFVDYIMEHLNLNGRAGVIVPEGIIFQSANAYKTLRKKLVEDNYLWAVVSLPAGVFNPYSGVKTSILLMDRNIAKLSDNILFLKIENDGFDLGAQRRVVDKNDIPDVLNIIKDYMAKLHGSMEPAHGNKGLQPLVSVEGVDGNKKGMVFLVSKKKLAENGEYNLTGERYRVIEQKGHQKWPMVMLGDVCLFINGRAFKPDEWEKKDSGGLPIIRIQNLNNPSNEFNYTTEKVEERYIVNTGDLLFSWSGSKGTSFGAHIWNNTKGVLNQHIFRVEFKSNCLKKYLYIALNKAVETVEKNLHGGVGLVHITKGNLERIQIPLPPLEVQQEIVAEIEGYQKIIDGARQVVDNWKPQIDIDTEWPMVKLGEVCDVRDGTHDSPKYVQINGFPLITSKNIKGNLIDFTNVNLISKKDLDKINERSIVDDGDIIMPMIGTIGNPIIIKKDRDFGIKNVALIKFFKDSKIINFFVKEILDTDIFNKHYQNQSAGSTQKFISLGFIRNLLIPLPPLEVQQAVVEKIEAERKAVEGCKELIEVYEGKIKQVIDRVWEE